MMLFDVANDGALLEEGPVILEVAEVVAAKEGQYGPQVEWHFHPSYPETPQDLLIGGDGNEYTFRAWSSGKMTPTSKARAWIEALYGRPLEKGERPEVKALIGRRMKTLIVHKIPEDGRVRAHISGEVDPKPYPRRGEQEVQPIPRPDPSS